jgi:hypothetical protein
MGKTTPDPFSTRSTNEYATRVRSLASRGASAPEFRPVRSCMPAEPRWPMFFTSCPNSVGARAFAKLFLAFGPPRQARNTVSRT